MAHTLGVLSHAGRFLRGGDRAVRARPAGSPCDGCAPRLLLGGPGAAVPVDAYAGGLLRRAHVFHPPHPASGAAPSGAAAGDGGVSGAGHAGRVAHGLARPAA
ncbi:hypothetical protein G6F68_020481 [Rhizopus microsporus]|nr:hypothetical protein G6F68_020481 [Rhizopus microsporus]